MVSVTSLDQQPRFRYRPQGEKLAAFGRSEAFMQVIRGPLGSGKTKGCVAKIIKRCVEQRPDKSGLRRSRWAAVRNTYPELVSTTIAEFREMVSPAMGKITMTHPPQCDLDFMLADGTRVQAEIIFIALDREEDIRKLRGLQLTGVYFNELRFIPLAIVREGLSRCDRYPQPGWSPWVGGIADTNAWDEDHPLEEMMAYFSGLNAEVEDENLRYAFEQMSKLGAWEFFNQPGAVVRAAEGEENAYRSLDGSWWKVNPAAENLSVLSPTYYARQIAGAKTDWIRVNLGNETGLAIDGKPVHPEFSDSMHRSEKPLLPIPGRVIRVGMDFGLTPAAVFWQQHANGRWHGLDELVCFDMGATRFADALKRKVADIRAMIPAGNNLEFVFRGDPSGDNRSATDEETYFSVLRANGISALPASTNDTAIRRDAITRPLTRLVDSGPGLLLSPKCKFLRKALKGGWCYRRVKVAGSDRFKDEAEKNEFSHVGEAAEYGLMDAGEHAVVNSSQAMRFPKGPVTPRVAPSGRDWLDVGW